MSVSSASASSAGRRSQCRPDGSSLPSTPPPEPPQAAHLPPGYYGGSPLWYCSSQNVNSGMGRTTGCSDKNGWRPSAVPQVGQATLQQVQGNRSPEDMRQLEFVGLQVADTAVEVPRLHGAVWGHQTYLTGVGPMEHHEENGASVPHLVPTAQAVWITNRHLPKGPSTGPPQPSEHRQYMSFTPTENKPVGTVPIKITNVNGKPDVLHLPVMPHLILQSVPGSPSTYMFHHVAWLFWPASGHHTSHPQCPQMVQMAHRFPK